MIKVGSDFSGVGAFNQALMRLAVNYKEVFACDMDKYARQTFIHNYGEPEYYPINVYEREIPVEPLDIYMTSPPCQAFSLAGKRLGKEDKRGILFFNSHEFIKVNKPRFFIFENVKGLLSDDGANTFNEWVNMLGGKSVNGSTIMFPYDDSVPYHLYWKVLNAKHHGVPQNRERVFLIGIRDDKDNVFRFPIEEHLIKRLKDVLEDDVDEKYYLSEKMIDWITEHRDKRESKNTFPLNIDDIGGCVTARYNKMGAEDSYIKIGTWRTHEDGKGFREIEDGNCPTIPARAREDGSGQPVVEIRKTTYGKHQQDCFYDSNGIIGSIPAGTHGSTPHFTKTLMPCKTKIRRLTPRECFRLMDFPDTFTWPVSDSQAYKQAGNSIVVNVLYKILKNLPL